MASWARYNRQREFMVDQLATSILKKEYLPSEKKKSEDRPCKRCGEKMYIRPGGGTSRIYCDTCKVDIDAENQKRYRKAKYAREKRKTRKTRKTDETHLR